MTVVRLGVPGHVETIARSAPVPFPAEIRAGVHRATSPEARSASSGREKRGFKGGETAKGVSATVYLDTVALVKSDAVTTVQTSDALPPLIPRFATS
jgi:hypothetical protein